MAIEIQQFKDYTVSLVNRSFGINYHLATEQTDRVTEILRGSRPGGNKEMGIIFSMLGFGISAYLRAQEVVSKINSTLSAEKPSPRFKTFATVTAVAIDTAPYLLVLANPLFFLLGKPILNAASHVVADIIESRLIRESRLPKAAQGTYNLLEQASHREYDPKLDGGILRDAEGQVLGTVVKERVCAIGGSCMELRLIHRDEEREWLEVTHITKGDRIVDIHRFGSPPEEVKQTPLKVADLTNTLAA